VRREWFGFWSCLERWFGFWLGLGRCFGFWDDSRRLRLLGFGARGRRCFRQCPRRRAWNFRWGGRSCDIRLLDAGVAFHVADLVFQSDAEIRGHPAEIGRHFA